MVSKEILMISQRLTRVDPIYNLPTCSSQQQVWNTHLRMQLALRRIVAICELETLRLELIINEIFVALRFGNRVLYFESRSLRAKIRHLLTMAVLTSYGMVTHRYSSSKSTGTAVLTMNCSLRNDLVGHLRFRLGTWRKYSSLNSKVWTVCIIILRNLKLTYRRAWCQISVH